METADTPEQMVPPIATPGQALLPTPRNGSGTSRRRRVRIRVRTFDSFRHVDYRLVWGGALLSSGGFWVQQVIVGWLTYNLTESAFLTSLALGVDTIPILLVGPFGGVLADRWDRRKLLVIVYLYQTLLTLGFSALVFAERVDSWHIFAFIIMMGASWVVIDPARMSMIPRIVPRENLVNAFALNGLAFNGSRLFAPGIAGGLLVVAGAGPALLFEAGLQATAVILALAIKVRSTESRGGGLASAVGDVREAIVYVWSNPLTRSLFLVGTVPALLMMPFVQGLMPVYTAEVFGVGASGLGLLMSTFGAGATVGALTMATVGDVRRKGLLVLLSIGIMGAAMLVFSRNTTYALAFPIIMVISLAMATFFTSINATLQGSIDDRFRGRVSALYMFTWGMFPIGSLLAGTLADSYGPRAATLVGGTAILITITVLALGPARALLRDP